MTQPDGWQSPYDPPQQNTPAPGQAPAPSPAQPPYPPQPYLPQPYQQGAPYQAGPYQPQPVYGAAPYGYAAPPEKNALGVWSLVLGILSIVMLFSCFVGILAGIPAVITGHLSRKAHKEGLADNPGLALGGIITGWVTIGLTLLAGILIGVLFSIPEFREGFFSESSSSYP
ncbi:hypothetical protein GCM10027063_19820 [Promicromonospora xylanilytica]